MIHVQSVTQHRQQRQERLLFQHSNAIEGESQNHKTKAKRKTLNARTLNTTLKEHVT